MLSHNCDRHQDANIEPKKVRRNRILTPLEWLREKDIYNAAVVDDAYFNLIDLNININSSVGVARSHNFL